MKKILASLAITFCLVLTMMGGGCSSCSPVDDDGNGGEQTVNTITTLEGVWESEKNKYGGFEKVIIENKSIKLYRNEGLNFTDELQWVGIYVPFLDPVSEGEWTFVENPDGYPIEHGRPLEPDTKTFRYADGKLSCEMFDAIGAFRNVYFTKVETK